jgi:hypothetical protein
MPEQESTSIPLAPTRESLHRVAEHVLSAALKRATGRIALRPGPGGVRTPPLDDDGRVLALVGTDIELLVGTEVTRRAPLTTVREAAEAVDVQPGFPWTKHAPGTPYAPDERLTVDPDAAEALAQWFALGDRALSLLGAELGAADDAVPQVYPEHFDLAISVDRVNYGASPGDAAIAEPYLYVGPYDGPPARDAFWNAPFGAFVTRDEVATPEDALAFFRSGRSRLAGLVRP